MVLLACVLITGYRFFSPLRKMNISCIFISKRYICISFEKGGLAQLARALPWHGRGHRFDSDILHEKLVFKAI